MGVLYGFGGDDMDKRLGAQYYTIREYCKNIEDFDESCRKVKEIGYDIVHLSGVGDFTKEEVEAVMDKHDLEVIVTHRPANRYLENLEEEIEFHKAIGCKICGLGSMPGGKADMETINAFVKNYKPICKRLEEEGLIFAYHNHAFEFEKVDGKFAFDIITEGMAADNFKYILDTYWLAFAGINPAKFIRERKGFISCVHLKDLKVIAGQPTYAEVGNGNIDWDDVLSACRDAEVQYAFVEQDSCTGNPFDSLKMSYDFLSLKDWK